MGKFNIRFLIGLILLSFLSDLNSQNRIVEYSHGELLKYKVDQSRFQIGYLSGSFEIPCLRDYTNEKLQTQVYLEENDSMIHSSQISKIPELQIFPSILKIDSTSKTIHIKGKISGAWKTAGAFEFKIYIGNRVDTVSYTTIIPNLHGDIFYNGVKVENPIVVDTIPAFYLSNFQKFTAFTATTNTISANNEIYFDIRSNFDKNSILVFGISSRYAEIFEIGRFL